MVKAGEAYALAISDFTSPFASCTLDFGSVSAIEDQSKSDFSGQVRVSPNPSSGSFDIFLEKNRLPETNLEIFDTQGRLVFAETCVFTNGLVHLNLDDQPAGIYFLKIADGEKMAVARLVKKLSKLASKRLFVFKKSPENAQSPRSRFSGLFLFEKNLG